MYVGRYVYRVHNRTGLYVCTYVISFHNINAYRFPDLEVFHVITGKLGWKNLANLVNYL